MTSFAPSLSAGFARPPSWRLLDDAALGQQIASALHAHAYEPGVEELLADYHIEGRGETVDGVERFDATRVVDGRWVTIEIPAIDAARNPAHVERFASIALAESGLRHRSVVAVLDIGMAPDGRPFRVREAVDLEPLAKAIARDGVLPWKRIRSIALQVCGGIAAARARGLRPRELSLVGCFRSRYTSVDEVKLGELVPLVGGPDEQAQVAAIAAMIDQLAGAGRTRAELAARVATLPPTELRDVLNRVRSEDPGRRIATLAELGCAIAAIGQGVTAWSRVRSSSTAGIIHDDAAGAMPAGAMVISCSRADAPAAPFMAAGDASPSTPRVIVGAGIEATTGGPSIGTLRREPPPPTRGGRVVAWLVLAGLVAAATLHVTVPELWPNLVAHVRACMQAIEQGFRGLEPGDLAARRVEPVPMAEVAPPKIAVVAATLELLPEPAPAQPAPPAQLVPVAPPIAAVPIAAAPSFSPSPPPPELVASPTPTRERRRAKRRTQPRPASAVVEDVPRTIDPIAAQAPGAELDHDDAQQDPQPVEVQDAVLHPTATIE